MAQAVLPVFARASAISGSLKANRSAEATQVPYFGYFATCERCRTFVASRHRSRSKNMVGSVLVKQSDLCARLHKIGTGKTVTFQPNRVEGFFRVSRRTNCQGYRQRRNGVSTDLWQPGVTGEALYLGKEDWIMSLERAVQPR